MQLNVKWLTFVCVCAGEALAPGPTSFPRSSTAAGPAAAADESMDGSASESDDAGPSGQEAGPSGASGSGLKQSTPKQAAGTVADSSKAVAGVRTGGQGTDGEQGQGATPAVPSRLPPTLRVLSPMQALRLWERLQAQAVLHAGNELLKPNWQVRCWQSCV